MNGIRVLLAILMAWILGGDALAHDSAGCSAEEMNVLLERSQAWVVAIDPASRERLNVYEAFSVLGRSDGVLWGGGPELGELPRLCTEAAPFYLLAQRWTRLIVFINWLDASTLLPVEFQMSEAQFEQLDIWMQAELSSVMAALIAAQDVLVQGS